VTNYREPDGWQALLRVHDNRALLVVHGFHMDGCTQIQIMLPAGEWKIEWALKRHCVNADIAENYAQISMPEPMEGVVLMLVKLQGAASEN